MLCSKGTGCESQSATLSNPIHAELLQTNAALRRPPRAAILRSAPRVFWSATSASDTCDGPGSHRLPERGCLAKLSDCSRSAHARPGRLLHHPAERYRCGDHPGPLAAARLLRDPPAWPALTRARIASVKGPHLLWYRLLCNLQAALALAAPALDAELQRDPTVGKALVKVRPGSALFPAPPAYEQV